MESPAAARPRTSFDMDTLVGTVLSTGVIASVALLSIGIVWQWIAIGKLGLDYTLPRINVVRFISGEVLGMLHEGFGPTRFVNLGIIVLMLTPYLRVLLSMFYFILVARNYKYATITAFVCTVLTFTLFLR
jgi:uncharacterized membrane protein